MSKTSVYAILPDRVTGLCEHCFTGTGYPASDRPAGGQSLFEKQPDPACRALPDRYRESGGNPGQTLG
ncbi:hypothetical protein D3C86_1964170 [compost metagenome]